MREGVRSVALGGDRELVVRPRQQGFHEPGRIRFADAPARYGSRVGSLLILNVTISPLTPLVSVRRSAVIQVVQPP
jgi:hypothetical protein